MSRESTFERWFYIVSILGVLAGGIIWLTSISFQASASADDIKALKAKSDSTTQEFEEIRIRLAHIEDAVGVKK